MERLKELFDYGRFAQNKKFDAVCKNVEKRYVAAKSLSDDDLATVAAAGEPFDTKDKTDDERNGHNG